jgi:hypothetical protein
LNECLAAVISLLVETLAAIDRSAFTGLKRHFCLFTTFSANGSVHLAGSPTATAHTFGFPVLTASRAAFGLIGVTLGLEEFLLGCRERE